MSRILTALVIGWLIGLAMAHGNFPGSWENGCRAGYSIAWSKWTYLHGMTHDPQNER